MAIDFPNSPTTGQTVATSYGSVRQWDGSKWVDATTAFLPLTGGTLSGGLSLGTAYAATSESVARHIDLFGTIYGFTVTANRLNYVCDMPSSAHVFRTNTADRVQITDTGLTLLGSSVLTLAADPTSPMQAATKQYVDNSGFLPKAGGTLTGFLSLGAGLPVVPSNVPYLQTLFAGEIVSDLGNHIAFNMYLAAGPAWKYRAAGYAGVLWQHTDGSARINVYASGSAGAGVTVTASLYQTQAGALVLPGPLFASNINCAGQFYISGDGTNSSQFNVASGYAVQWVKSNNIWRFLNTAQNWYVDPNGTSSQPGQAWASDFVASRSMYPSNTNASGWLFETDGTNNAIKFSEGWSLAWQPGTGNYVFQHAVTSWLTLRSGDAVIFNNIVQLAGVGPYGNYSDVRDKRDIAESRVGLAAIKELRPIFFTRLPRAENLPEPRRDLGFIAQEVREVIPEAVVPFDDLESDEPLLGIATDPIIAAMVNAVKELDARLGTIEATVANF